MFGELCRLYARASTSCQCQSFSPSMDAEPCWDKRFQFLELGDKCLRSFAPWHNISDRSELFFDPRAPFVIVFKRGARQKQGAKQSDNALRAIDAGRLGNKHSSD